MQLHSQLIQSVPALASRVCSDIFKQKGQRPRVSVVLIPTWALLPSRLINHSEVPGFTEDAGRKQDPLLFAICLACSESSRISSPCIWSPQILAQNLCLWKWLLAASFSLPILVVNYPSAAVLYPSKSPLRAAGCCNASFF